MLKTFLLAVLLVLESCATPLPSNWRGKIYQGKHDASLGMDGNTHGGIVRKQDGEIILADEAQFDQFMAMSWADFQSFSETFVFSCKEWNQNAPFTFAQIKSFLQSLKETHP